VESLTALRRLFANYTSIGDGGLESIAKLPHLSELQISNNQITDFGTHYLSQRLSLQKLNLRNTQITDDGLMVLSKLHKLESLTLNNTIEEEIKKIERSSMPASINQTRYELIRKKIFISEKGVSALKKALPECRILSF
jgi:Leucine-rich repeat (LRR) protein